MYQNKIELSPQDILEKDFKIDTRGYRLKEVDQFLDIIINVNNTTESIVFTIKLIELVYPKLFIQYEFIITYPAIKIIKHKVWCFSKNLLISIFSSKLIFSNKLIFL